MPLTLLPLLLLLIPLTEIAVFILVGQLIGLWPTLALVLLTAIVGTVLLRRQGLGALGRIQAEIRAGRLPGRELVHAAMILAAGLLLLTPGLVSDTLGFLLFVPGVRDGIWNFLKTRVVVTGARAGGLFRHPGQPNQPGRRPDVVDLSQNDFQRRPDPASPWSTRDDDDAQNRTLH